MLKVLPPYEEPPPDHSGRGRGLQCFKSLIYKIFSFKCYYMGKSRGGWSDAIFYKCGADG